MLVGVLHSIGGVVHRGGRRNTMEHHFSFPTVTEIVQTRPVPAPPRPPALSQPELVRASLLRCPESRTVTSR
jgi:hypothetical protein